MERLLEPLLQTLKKVRKRIEEHRSSLRQNEMLTRYALIDPVLRALGWDTEDPNQVIPEFQTEVGRPDYVLRHERETMGLEAKKLGADEKTFEEARRKALPLWQERRIRYYIITDGDQWQVWDISRPKDEHPQPLVNVRLSSAENLAHLALQLLKVLWFPAIPSMERAPKPIVAGGEEGPPPKTFKTLEDLSREVRPGQKPPKGLRFPDGHEVKDLRAWNGLLVEVTRWALPRLQERSALPLRSKRLVVAQSSEGMKAPKEVGGGFYVETNFSASEIVHHSCFIVERAGAEPKEVLVLEEPG